MDEVITLLAHILTVILIRESDWILRHGFTKTTLTQQHGYTKDDCEEWNGKTATVEKIKKV